MPAGKMVEANLARPGISERSARERGVVAEVDIEVSAQTGTGGFGRPCRFLIGPYPLAGFFYNRVSPDGWRWPGLGTNRKSWPFANRSDGRNSPGHRRGRHLRRHPYGGSPWGPRGPGGPWGPAGPVAPTGPAGPVGPATPGSPLSPFAPAGPGGPAGPRNQSQPLKLSVITKTENNNIFCISQPSHLRDCLSS